jgi:hypothetical protein
VPATNVHRLTGERFALSRRGGEQPTEEVIDFSQHPLLAIDGDGTGKTTALPTTSTPATGNRIAEQAALRLVIQAGLRTVDDALPESLHPRPTCALAFDVTIAAEHQERRDRFVEVAR